MAGDVGTQARLSTKRAGQSSSADEAPAARPRRGAQPKPRPGTIRHRNVTKILKAAEAVFAKKGFSGGSTAEIARKAGVPKANLHYYFRTKQLLYESVIDRILEVWLDALEEELQPDAEPGEAIARYVSRKIELSRTMPQSSRLWAMELLSGGRHVGSFLRGRVRSLVVEKSKVINQWIADGKIDPIDPAHLIFMLWASTQTYADFAVQIGAVLGRDPTDAQVFEDATKTATALFQKGIGLRR